MDTGKRCISVLMVLVITCTLILPMTALGLTIDEKADALHQLGILADTAANSNLSENLSRAHAAAFIVRLSGKEEHVNKYAEIYSITSFPDVDPTQWYAKYVGYCAKEKIIVGTAAGKYEPTGDISEKAFLRLVLSALGYIYNEDYPLEQVYTRAYSLGLVTDPSYFNRTEDNVNYTRGQAVDVLYNALKVINKNTGKEMFQSLIDEGAFTREAAVKAGLIADIETSIEEIKAIDFNKVYVKFNENIRTVSNDNIIMYVNGNVDDRIECSLASLVDNELVLYAPNRGSKNTYNLVLLNVEDENGNITSEISGVFAGYELETEVIESDYFRIKSVEGISEKSIRILFTHPINENTEVPGLYSIYEENNLFAGGKAGDIAVKVNSSLDGVILTLNNKVFSQNIIYTLRIDGDLTSTYGVKLNDGAEDSMKFVASSGSAGPFALERISCADNKTLLLSFNKEINPVLAGQKYSFLVTDEEGRSAEIEKTGVDRLKDESGNTMFINIKDTLEKNGKYLLTIYIMSDVGRQEYITEKTYSFTADYKNADELKISDVKALDSQTIEVTFSMPLDAKTAVMADHYSIVGTNVSYYAIPEKVFYDMNVNQYKVKLYLDEKHKLTRTKDYYVSVDSDMRDYIGNTAGKDIKKAFDGSSLAAGTPTIDDAVTISSDAIKLTFDREIALDALNILTSNYVLEYSVSDTQYKKVPLSVIYINAKTVILKFDTLPNDDDITFTVKYNKLKDYSGAEGTQGQAEVRRGEK